MAKFWDATQFTGRPNGVIPGCFGVMPHIVYPLTDPWPAPLVAPPPCILADAESESTQGLRLDLRYTTGGTPSYTVPDIATDAAAVKAWAATMRAKYPSSKIVYYTQLLSGNAFRPADTAAQTAARDAIGHLDGLGLFDAFHNTASDNYYVEAVTNYDGMVFFNRDINRGINAKKDGQTWAVFCLDRHPSDDPSLGNIPWSIAESKLRLLAATFDNVVLWGALSDYDPMTPKAWGTYPHATLLTGLIAELGGSTEACELFYVNRAFRYLGQPPVTSLTESPDATMLRDRIVEFNAEYQTTMPFYFQRADWKMNLTGGNGIPWRVGERVTESVTNAALELVAVAHNTAWFRTPDRTSTLPRGGNQLTGQTSGATRNGTTLVALPPDEAWSICDVPRPFGDWIAAEAGLSVERQYKRGQSDDLIVSQAAARLRNTFLQWDCDQAGATWNKELP